MGLFSWLTGQPEPQPNQNEQQEMTLDQKEKFAKSHTDYSDMNCMSCKYLKKDGSGFYCERSMIASYRNISKDSRVFGFYDSETYASEGMVVENSKILLNLCCGDVNYWDPRIINSEGYTVCNYCGDIG